MASTFSSRFVTVRRAGFVFGAARGFTADESLVRNSHFLETWYKATALLHRSSLARCLSALAEAQAKKEDKKLKNDALDIYYAGLDVVDPKTAAANVLIREGDVLRVGKISYHLDHNVYVAAFGKAAAGMVRAVDDVLGDHVVTGIASVRHGIIDALKAKGLSSRVPSEDSAVKIVEGGISNFADDISNATSLQIRDLAKKLQSNDILIVLISGGGSRLLSAPCPPITIDDQNVVSRLLLHAGANASDVNAMRRHTSLLKGGRLARLAAPAKVLALIVSDTPGDALEVIASGPTAPDPTTPRHCLDLVKAFNIEAEFPVSVRSVLTRRLTELEEASRPSSSLSSSFHVEFLGGCLSSEKDFSHVQNVLVANGKALCLAAAERATNIGYHTFVLTSRLTGVASERGVEWGRLAAYASYMLKRKGSEPDKDLVKLEMSLVEKGLRKETAKELGKVASAAFNSGQGLCIISAGSPEVAVPLNSSGLGGRNQTLALAAAVELDRLKTAGRNASWHKDVEIAFLCMATDGLDGPGHCAAGVFVDDNTILRARDQGLDPDAFMRENNTYGFFRLLGADTAGDAFESVQADEHHLVTGVTGTSVGDFQVLLIRSKK